MTQPDSDTSWKAGGTHPNIVTVGDPTLRGPAEPVDDLAAVRIRLMGWSLSSPHNPRHHCPLSARVRLKVANCTRDTVPTGM